MKNLYPILHYKHYNNCNQKFSYSYSILNTIERWFRLNELLSDWLGEKVIAKIIAGI
jgi:hypothetical protein